MSLVSRPKKRAYSVMRLQILQRGWFTILFLAGILSIVTAMTLIEASSASGATSGILFW